MAFVDVVVNLVRQFVAYVQGFTPVSKQVEPVDQMTSLILARNGAYKGYYPNALSSSRVISAEIHKVTPAVAAQVATLMVAASKATGLPLTFLAACSYQESQWDPACYNKNLNESKGVETFEGTDWGITQNSGYQLVAMPEFAGVATGVIAAKALDANWAIPLFGQKMLNLYKWASDQVENPKIASQIKNLDSSMYTPSLSMPALPHFDHMAGWLATTAYNRGQTGILEFLANPGHEIYPHGKSVQTWMSQFAPILNPEVSANA